MSTGASSGNMLSRASRLVLLVWVVVVGAGAWAGASLLDTLPASTQAGPRSDSELARHIAETTTGERSSLVVRLPVAERARATTWAQQFARLPGVATARPAAAPSCAVPCGVLRVGITAGADDATQRGVVTSVRAALASVADGSEALAGPAVLDTALNRTAKHDLSRAEGVALPLIIVLFAFLVRSVRAAALTAALVMATTSGGMCVLWLVSRFTEVSAFAVNVVTMFGIGLSVDYGLVMVTGFRRALGAVADARAARLIAMLTSGRAVRVSGATVAVALAGLLAFTEPILRSIAYAGIGTVMVSVLASTTLLPCLLDRFGGGIRPERPDRNGRRFATVARGVQGRPVVTVVGVLAAAGLLAAPVLGVRLEGLDSRVLPASSVERREAAALAAVDPALAAEPLVVTLRADPAGPETQALKQAVWRLEHVRAVDVVAHRDGWTVLTVTSDVPAGTPAARELLQAVRALPSSATLHVGGITARNTDFTDSVLSRAPAAAGLVGTLTFAVLFLSTGAVVVAVKGVAMNAVSLGAGLGVLVWGFQHGHLATLLGFTPTGGLDVLMLCLTAVFALGLATDYEVFLLNAVMTARRAGLEDDEAVAAGVACTGRLITLAALLMVLVFVGFASGDLLVIQQLGVGLAVAVIVDATLVRLLLAPAVMTLLGRRNWWGPGWALRASARGIGGLSDPFDVVPRASGDGRREPAGAR